MECSTKTKILRVLNLLVILSLCLWVKFKNDKTKEMINWNTKIINSIAVVSFTQSQNADILLDIIKELDKSEHQQEFDGGSFASLVEDDLKNFKIEKIQPDSPPEVPDGWKESYIQKPFSAFKVDANGIEELPASFNQVIEDLQRIDLSVRAFASNNLFQKQSLELIYQKISSGRKELEELNEEDIYYIIEEDRYDDATVKEITDEDVENFQWSFITSNGLEDETPSNLR